MPHKTIKAGTFYRSVAVDRSAINEEGRTVQLAFSSELPVERWFGNEILDHSPQSVRLGRLNSGGAVLMDHNMEDQVGVVEKAFIGSDRMARAEVRFGRGVRAEEVFRDIIDGIRRNVSVGYRIHALSLEEEKDGVSTYRATDWEPLEVSVVSIPADTAVGVGRSEENDENEIIITRRIEMPAEIKVDEHEKLNATIPDVGKIRDDASNQERNRVQDILKMGEKHRAQDAAIKFVNEGRPPQEFGTWLLENRYKAEPIVQPNPDIGLSEKEIRTYSIVRAIRQLAELRPLDGLEREVSDTVAKTIKRDAKGFFIPNDVMRQQRAMSAAVATAGGFTVGSEVMGASMIELLRNKALISQLGARTLSGLTGNVLIPRVTGGATAYWLSETGPVTASDQTFGQLALVPHRLVGDTAYSKELLMQSSIDIEAFVREDLMTVLAIEKDRAAINGLGANGEPLGIIGTTGINTVTFGAAATWAKVIDFETQVATGNADVGNMAYLTTPAVRGKWKSAVKVTSQAVFLWEDGAMPGSGMVNGYLAEATKQVPSDKVIFGNWADLIIGEWAGIDVVVDPYSLKKTGQIEVTITLWCDMGVRHAVSFTVSTDSGAQ